MIGVVILLPLFAHDIKAFSPSGHYELNEVVDTTEYVNTSITRVYSHYVVNITTNTDDAYGVININGTNYTYSGKNTTIIGPRRVNTIQPNTSLPLTQYIGNFTPTLLVGAEGFQIINNTYKGYTTDFNTYNTSIGRWVDANNWFTFGQMTFSDNNTNDVYVMEVPIGNTTLKDENLTIAYYSTFNNRPNTAILSNLYINQTVSKLYIYFTLNEEFAAWPYGTGLLCIKSDKRAYLYNATFKLYKVPYQSSQYYDLITDIKLWKYLDSHNDTPAEVPVMNNTNDSFVSKSQDMINMENQLQSDFNNSISNINIPSDPYSNMGTMFGQSSRFLVHMFNNFTESSPYGTLITFSLILGLALLMIGKKG